MGGIVRRVTVALSIALAALSLWLRRIDPPRPSVLVAPVERAATLSAGGEVAITPGWRSVTLPFDEALSVASFIQPGSRIDILRLPPPGAAERSVPVVMEDVRVLAVGDVRERPADGRPIRASTLTVEVRTEADEDRLVKAASTGALSYALRGSGSRNVGVVRVAPLHVETVVLGAETCTNRRDSTLVYDAVLLSCMRKPAVFLADSATTVPNPDR